MTSKKFDFNIRLNPELNRYTDQVLFPEQVARATQFLLEAGLPNAVEPTPPALSANKTVPSHLQNTTLQYFISHLLPREQDTSDYIRHFPTEELLNDFLYVVEKKPDQEVKIILHLLLNQRPTATWNSNAFQQTFSLADTSHNRTGSNAPLPTSPQGEFTGLEWVLGLIPAFPLEAIKSIEAYLLAHWSTLPATYAEALNECEAIIRTKYLNHSRPSQVLADLSARDFEFLVASLYEGQGYHTKISNYHRDTPFDIQAVNYRNPDYQVLLIECKSSDRAVGIAETKRLLMTVNATESAKGVLVTTSRFSAEAVKFASTKHHLELIDGEHLVSLLNTHLEAYWLSKVDKYISTQKRKQLQQQ